MEGIIGVLIPIVAIVGSFIMVVFLRRYEKEERLKMIEKGMNPEEFKHLAGKYRGGGALKWGLLLVGGGIGLVLAKLLEPLISGDPEAIYFGLIALFGG